MEREGVVYRLTRWSDADYIFKRIVADVPGATVTSEHVERVAKFTLEDFRFMLGLYDMTIDTVFGDYSLSAFDKDTSPRLIVVATAIPSTARH